MVTFHALRNDILARITPTKQELSELNALVKPFLERLNKAIKQKKVKAKAFVGGSFAKGTLIKKEVYDIDIFLRFSPLYDDKTLASRTAALLARERGVERVHGSRDYFRVALSKHVYVELIPVRAITKAQHAKNSTDLSSAHVRYVKRHATQKMLEDIRLAKAFAHSCSCYGAESYVQGFSGYALELLILSYGNFLSMLRALSRAHERVLLDPARHYQRKRDILLDVNSSKLASPIVLIDPTYKARNALAALSNETFERFVCAARAFLQKPAVHFFFYEPPNISQLLKRAKAHKHDAVVLEIFTNKQAGDIAGSKLKKFFGYFKRALAERYHLSAAEFLYFGKQQATFFFIGKAKKNLLHEGPFIDDGKNVKRFKKEHKKTFTKKKKLYATRNVTQSLKEFVFSWKKRNIKHIKEMAITKILVKD